MPSPRTSAPNGSLAHSWAFPPKSVDFLHCDYQERGKTIRRFQESQRGLVEFLKLRVREDMEPVEAAKLASRKRFRRPNSEL